MPIKARLSTFCAALLIAASCHLTGVAAAEGEGEKTVTATVIKGAIVRFGPNTKADPAGTLKVGDTVEVLGTAPGVDGWYLIRFPRQCKAWMHEKLLQPVEGGKKFKVIEDKAKVRSDAKQTGMMVAELNVGDVVEAKDEKVGAWVAVYPPTAVAYVWYKLVDLPAQKLQAINVQAVKETEAERIWKVAQETYQNYQQFGKEDIHKIYNLDWAGLSEQMAKVMDQHPSPGIRAEAESLKAVVDKVAKILRDKGYKPTVSVPQPPSQAVATTTVVKDPVPSTSPVGQDPVVKNPPENTAPPANPPKPTPGNNPPTPPTGGDDQALTKVIAAQPDAGTSKAFSGYLEQRDVPEVGVSYVLLGDSSNVIAFLKLKEGSTVQLPEYHWRPVVVKGEAKPVDAKLHKLGDNIPLVMIDSIALQGH